MFVSTIPMELLNKVTTGGVAVNYRFTRHPHLYAPRMVGIELTFSNLSTEEIPIIKLGSKSLPSGMSLHEFPALSNIPPEQSRSVTLGIDYNDTTQAAKLDLVIGSRHPSYCLHQLSYWGDGEAPQHVPDGLHPGAGDSTCVHSVQYSNLLLLRPS